MKKPHSESENEKLVKELYEKYPYPNRNIVSKEKLSNYVKWVSKIFGKDISFWNKKTILELGCGTGELANSLSMAGGKITAIDFSNSSISKAEQLKRNVKSNANFLCKNILEIKDDELGKFDVVIALGSLHHTINARKGFSIAIKHCKKDGIVIVGLYNKYSRFRQRIRRFFIYLFAGKNIEKRIKIGKKLFGGNDNQSWLADKYGQVHESYHSINEIQKWFRDEGLAFVASKPKYKTPILDEIKWFFTKESAFFVMVGKKE